MTELYAKGSFSITSRVPNTSDSEKTVHVEIAQDEKGAWSFTIKSEGFRTKKEAMEAFHEVRQEGLFLPNGL